MILEDKKKQDPSHFKMITIPEIQDYITQVINMLTAKIRKHK